MGDEALNNEEPKEACCGFVGGFLRKEVPASLGWKNTLGVVAGALLLTQFLTGILMALYYVPHPEAAYQSVKYVEESVTAGRLTRALHYWGASFVLVALFLHVARVFFSGGYRKPRHLVWIVGLILFVLVIKTAFFGQLLPWDQHAYWAATVGTEIAASAPVVGPLIHKLIVAGDAPGALTLTRFYTLHVVVFPGLILAGVALHFTLLRRHGRSRPAGDESDATRPYSPFQLSRDLMAVTVVMVGLIGVAWMFGGPDQPIADPSDTSHVPRPEWYFYAPYELMQFTPGDMQTVATVHLPGALLLLLILLPWLDRAKSAAPRKRPIIVAGGAVVFFGIIGLTGLGIISDPPDIGEAEAPATYDMVAAGKAIYVKDRCRRCHLINGDGRPNKGPDLSGTGLRLQASYLKSFLPDPEAYNPDTDMSAVELSPREMNELIAYLMSLQTGPGEFVAPPAE